MPPDRGKLELNDKPGAIGSGFAQQEIDVNRKFNLVRHYSYLPSTGTKVTVYHLSNNSIRISLDVHDLDSNYLTALTVYFTLVNPDSRRRKVLKVLGFTCTPMAF